MSGIYDEPFFGNWFIDFYIKKGGTLKLHEPKLNVLQQRLVQILYKI
jgi:hypothetical protein